jgi:hypothetical protein
MTYALDEQDYKVILKFYDINTHKLTKRELKQKATDILANKLCRCINNINTTVENPVGVCKHSVIRKKSLVSGNVKCGKKARFILPKKNKRTLSKKTKRTISLPKNTRKSS